MTKIVLCGACGKMGAAIAAAVDNRSDCEIVAGVDIAKKEGLGFPVYSSFAEISETANVVIDFSNPVCLDDMLAYCIEKKLPAVICTTGYSPEQVAQIKEASKEIAIFYSGNMSLGINLLIELSKKAAKVFGESFDIEIIEKHHNQKLDAPSGTALMIADAITEYAKNDAQYVYDRHAYRKKRDKREIGIHAVRGGNIVGEHEVLFAGTDELFTISHSARSKSVFAVGAVNAAVYMNGQSAGMYDMSDLLSAQN